MSSSDRLPLSARHKEVERLRGLTDAVAGEPHIEPMRQLVQEADCALQEAMRIGAAAGLLAGPVPWWEAWQRRHQAGAAAAPTLAGETPPTQAHLREGEAALPGSGRCWSTSASRITRCWFSRRRLSFMA